MWGTNKEPQRKLRDKIAKLAKKGKLGEAIELQRQLCEESKSVLDWQALRDLARQARLPRVEFAAGMMAAKLARAGPEQWLALAELAEATGLPVEAVDATFRAADAAAVSGDCRLAMTLCEKVLAREPTHGAARRIHGLMRARLEAEQLAGDEEVGESSITLLGGHGAPGSAAGPPDLSGEFAIVDEPQTLTDWPPVSHAVAETEPSRCWPTLLQERSLLFVGRLADLPDVAELNRLAEPRQLVPGQPLFAEGESCDLLYRLEEGTVDLNRAEGNRAGPSKIDAGAFFGDLGALTRLPATLGVTAAQSCGVTVLSRRKLRELVEEGRAAAALQLLKGLYLAAALRLSVLSSRCTQEDEETLASLWRFTMAKAGEPVTKAGDSGPLHVIVAGLAEVTAGAPPQSLGLLGPGDLVAELDPSPVTVTARRDLYAITFDRSTLGQLPSCARDALQAHRDRCRRALSRANATSESC